MNSPYFEVVKNKDQEVLFLFEPHDETVMLILNQYKRKNLVGIEQSSQKQSSGDDLIIEGDTRSLSNDQAQELKAWLAKSLEKKVKNVKVSKQTHDVFSINLFIACFLVDNNKTWYASVYSDNRQYELAQIHDQD